MRAGSTTSPGSPEMYSADRDGQLSVSDWADQDLLTKDQARERLSHEIARTRANLDRLGKAGVDAGSEMGLLARRLAAMESIRNEYHADLDRT